MVTTMDEGLLRYFADRDEQRRQEIEQAYPRFEADMRAFVEAHREDATPGGFVARLVRETAVAAYVQGSRHAPRRPLRDTADPGDNEIFARALEPIRAWPDLYPVFALFDGHESEPDEAEDAP